MGYFTARERSAPGNSAADRAQARPREFVRDDFAPRRRPTNTDIGAMVQQVRDSSVRRIDAVIADLQHRREAILEESRRMRRELASYAQLNQSTMDSTRVITESLANFAKLPDAPAMSELNEAVSDREDRDGASEQLAEDDAKFDPADDLHLPGTRAGLPIPQRREAADE